LLLRHARHLRCQSGGNARARGGIFIGGGVVPRLGAYFDQSPFRSRFENKGRFTAYMQAIPTNLITASYPALVGVAALLDAALRRA